MRPRPILAAILIGSLFAATVAPLILVNSDRGRAAYDQNFFHLPAIQAFSRQWPHFDFRDYSAASTPGYHIVVAAMNRFVSGDLRVLRGMGALFSLGLVVTLAAGVAMWGRQGTTVLLCLPVICSLYFYSSAVWLLPENAGWWGVLIVLLISLRRQVDWKTYWLGGGSLLLLVLVRQSHLWAAAPLWTAAWVGSDGFRRVRTADHNPIDANGPRCGPYMSQRSWLRLAAMVVATLPAFAAAAWFVMIWHGMTPPSQRTLVGGINTAGPAMALAVAGALGIFYVPMMLASARARYVITFAAVGGLIGLILGAAPISTYSLEAGRYSGLWNVVKLMPCLWDRSPVFIGLAALGGSVIAMWLATMNPRERWIWGVAAVAFGAVQLATRDAYQRYDEPLVLIAAALSLRGRADQAPKWTWAGPLVLAVILAGITVLSLR